MILSKCLCILAIIPAALVWTAPGAHGPGSPVNTAPSKAAETESAGSGGRAQAPLSRPFQRQVSIPLGSRRNAATFRVPRGKHLVIEHVWASAAVPYGQDLLLRLETTVNGESAGHFLVPSWPDARRITMTDHDLIRFRQWVRVYADSGSIVVVRAARSGNWGDGSAAVTVSGFLVESR
jgi:hypothetical protein